MTVLDLVLPSEYQKPIATETLQGGSVTHVQKLSFATIKPIIVKWLEKAPKGFFNAEANSLRALAEAGTHTPEILHQEESYLILSYVESKSQPESTFWLHFGEALAKQHTMQKGQFGWGSDNYLGTTWQRNEWTDNGFDFYAENRYLHMAKLARDEGLLSGEWTKAIERFCAKLPELIPKQPASLLHGDLWSGNVLYGIDNKPSFIDPACYYGWREADLAMTKMFGGFSPALLDYYEDLSPLEPGFSHRVDYYNLYHWLNHLYSFGDSYMGQVQGILRSF